MDSKRNQGGLQSAGRDRGWRCGYVAAAKAAAEALAAGHSAEDIALWAKNLQIWETYAKGHKELLILPPPSVATAAKSERRRAEFKAALNRNREGGG